MAFTACSLYVYVDIFCAFDTNNISSGFLGSLQNSYRFVFEFSSVCRKCIYDKISDEEIECCPVCNIDLGCVPLEKLR